MANLNLSIAQLNTLLTQQPQQGQGNTIMVARVTHVVTGPFIAGTALRDVFYKNPKDLGKITFQFLKGYQDRTEVSNGNIPAKPLNSAMKHMPVEGEFVQIVVGPSLTLNETRGQIDYYYTAPFDLWGASHHNALVDLGDYNQFINDTVSDYQQNQATNRANNTTVSGSTSMAYPLGPNFYEKSDIKPLRVFTGDVTLEGRWGNSIRFGSTSPNKGTDNYWSETGSIGNPITIIRNGQGPQLDKTAWIPTVENINRDGSSIYLTMGQRIVIDDIQANFSLASWQTSLESTQTTSIPIQQQLTSYDMISPAAQDQFVSDFNKQTNNLGIFSNESNQ